MPVFLAPLLPLVKVAAEATLAAAKAVAAGVKAAVGSSIPPGGPTGLEQHAVNAAKNKAKDELKQKLKDEAKDALFGDREDKRAEPVAPSGGNEPSRGTMVKDASAPQPAAVQKVTVQNPDIAPSSEPESQHNKARY